MSSLDSVTATTVVAVDPSTAFHFFTDEIDLWWRRDPRHRFATEAPSVIRIEPGVGGRLLEASDKAGGVAFEIGRVLVWEPPARLVLEWRRGDFHPGDRTEVEVHFESIAQGTRVTVVHRGWDSLPADHPARHGLSGRAFVSMLGLWWAELLVALGAPLARSQEGGG